MVYWMEPIPTRFLVLLWNLDIIEALTARGHSIDTAERAQLLYILTNHARWSKALDIGSVVDELIARPNFLKGSAGITKLLELHAQRVAHATKAIRKRRLISAPPVVAEFISSDARYYLAKLFLKEHFQQESAWLRHCLGARYLDHYLGRAQKGEIEIFSLRELATHKPVVTIEYEVSSQYVRQIKTACNALIQRSDPHFSATMDAVSYLWFGTAYDPQGVPYTRGTRTVADIHHLTPRDGLLLGNGLFITAREALTLQQAIGRYIGRLSVPADLEPVDVARLCERRGIDFDFTHATAAQRAAIHSVNGSLFDSSEMVSYRNLVRVAGYVEAPNAKHIDMQKLESIGAHLRAPSATLFCATKLRSIGSDLDVRGASGIVAPELNSVAGCLDARNAHILYLPQLRSVAGDLHVPGITERVDLRQLQTIAGHFRTDKAKTLFLPRLRSVEGNLAADAAVVVALPWLESVVGYLGLATVTQVHLPQLRAIGGYLTASSAKTVNIPNLRTVRGDIDVADATEVLLPSLRTIGGNLQAPSAESVDIGQLRSARGFLHVGKHNPEDLSPYLMEFQRSRYVGTIRNMGQHELLGAQSSNTLSNSKRPTISYTIVADACEGTGDCIAVCPAECIHWAEDKRNQKGTRYVYIDPSTCIDCGACLSVCPIEGAIIDEWIPDLQKP